MERCLFSIKKIFSTHMTWIDFWGLCTQNRGRSGIWDSVKIWHCSTLRAFVRCFCFFFSLFKMLLLVYCKFQCDDSIYRKISFRKYVWTLPCTIISIIGKSVCRPGNCSQKKIKAKEISIFETVAFRALFEKVLKKK